MVRPSPGAIKHQKQQGGDEMKDFNYEKGWFQLVKPVIDELSEQEKADIMTLAAMVKDRPQQKDLNIKLEIDNQAIFASYSTRRLAELSRAFYFVTHWKPGTMPAVDVLGGCPGWKVANILDQILKQRLDLPKKIRLLEGKLRVTFSSRDCWLWEEFGLATEKNLELYKNCGLSFGETTLDESAAILAKQCGDLWPDPDDMPDSLEYSAFLYEKRLAATAQQKKWAEKQLEDLDNKVAGLKREHHIRKTFLEDTSLSLWHLQNLIYYVHSNEFCFGWLDKMTPQEVEEIQRIIRGCDKLDGFNFTFKTI